MTDEPGVILVSIPFLLSINEIGRFKRTLQTEKAIQERLQQRKETNCQRQGRFLKPSLGPLFSLVLTISLCLARWQRLSINGAIRIQAIVGALTTASQLQDQHTYSRSLNHPLREGFLLGLLVQLGAAVAVLGGISTVLASYLAKVRGLGEPKPLLIRTRELNSFPREIPTFIVDDGLFLFF